MGLKSAIAMLVLGLSCLPAGAQSSGFAALRNRSEAAASVTGNMQSEANGAGVTADATNAGGLLLTYRYRFSDRLSFEGNGGFTTFTQYYKPSLTQEQANVYEASGAVVYHLRKSDAWIRPFVEGGAGMILFSPVAGGSTSGGSRKYGPAVLYGGGFDVRAFGPWSLRLGYRGLLYRAPDFQVAEQHTGVFAHMAEPYLGIVLRF